MSDFIKALEGKIKALQKEKTEHESAIAAIESKLELLGELYWEEMGQPVPATTNTPSKKRKPGRPKGSTKKNKVSKTMKHAVADDLYEEAMRQVNSLEGGGTSKDLQERMVKRYSPQPRPQRELGPGITAGTKKQIESAQTARKVDTTISIDEGE